MAAEIQYKHPNVMAVVVNWNSGHQLATCLKSLHYQCSVVVVDNASVDGSEKVAEQGPGVTLIKPMQNLGFAKACNLGAQHAKAEWILFINPDAAVYEDTLEHVLAYMQSAQGERVGICGAQLIDEAGHVARSCSRFPTPRRFVAQAFGLDKLAPRMGCAMTEWPHHTTQRVDQVIGAFFLMRAPLFAELGGFDERFFLYYEEVDLSYRANQAGWQSVYVAHAKAFHKGGGTSNQVKALRLFYILRSRLQYSFKHFTPWGAGLVVASTLVAEPIARTLLGVARRSVADLHETWQAYAMLGRWGVQHCWKRAK